MKCLRELNHTGTNYFLKGKICSGIGVQEFQGCISFPTWLIHWAFNLNGTITFLAFPTEIFLWTVTDI